VLVKIFRLLFVVYDRHLVSDKDACDGDWQTDEPAAAAASVLLT